MHRFYLPNENFTTKWVDITDPSELHHLKNVLRAQPGQKVALFNGKGKEAIASITKVEGQKIQFEIQNILSKKETSQLQLILACALPKKGKFETIIEKTTELGIDEIIPLITQRTEIRLKKEAQEKKLKRFQTVAINAAKQSKRTEIPQIHSFTTFPDVLKELRAKNITIIILSLQNPQNTLKAVLEKHPESTKTAFLIGPEGDFTKEEYALAEKNQCIPVTLGKTVLKVETAAICAIACARQFNI